MSEIAKIRDILDDSEHRLRLILSNIKKSGPLNYGIFLDDAIRCYELGTVRHFDLCCSQVPLVLKIGALGPGVRRGVLSYILTWQGGKKNFTRVCPYQGIHV